jgi:hypothetical protein
METNTKGGNTKCPWIGKVLKPKPTNNFNHLKIEKYKKPKL